MYSGPGGGDKVPGHRHFVAAFAGAVTMLALWLLLSPARWPNVWLGSLVVVASLGLAALLTMALDILLGTIGRRWTWWRPRPRRAVALPVTVALVAALLAGLATASMRPSTPARDVPCELPVELRIATTAHQFDSARGLFDQYVEWTAERNQGCPAVRPYLYSVATDPAVAALTSGWAALPEIGPRPDLWFPDAAEDIDEVRAAIAAAETGLAGLDEQLVGWSPVVLALSRSSVTEQAERERLGRSWQELLSTAQDQSWELVRPDPAVSVAGDLVNIAVYGAYPTDGDAIAAARQLEVRLAQSLDRGGYQLADSSTLLCQHRQRGAAAAGTAVLVTEQAVVRFNRGDPVDRACDPAPVAGPMPAAPDTAAGCGARDPLLAFYPIDTLTAGYHAVVLDWQEPSAPQADEAVKFQRWLSGEGGREALLSAGLRPVGLPAAQLGTPLVSGCGALPAGLGADGDHRPPEPAAAARAQSAYQVAQRPGRVLIAMDTSGSMETETAGGRTRHDVAVQAVEGALGRLGERDEFGLWVFPGADGGPEQLVPVGPATAEFQGRPRDQAAVEALASQSVGGSTPLHRTIVEGVAAVEGYEDRITALVVVTDGEETEHDPAVDEALFALDDTAGVRVYVVAVGEANCRIEAIAGVTSRTNGDCVPADFHALDGQLSELFGVLWSGG